MRYSKPQLIDLSLHLASGNCEPTGSGDTKHCKTGNNALGFACKDGNSATNNNDGNQGCRVGTLPSCSTGSNDNTYCNVGNNPGS